MSQLKTPPLAEREKGEKKTGINEVKVKTPRKREYLSVNQICRLFTKKCIVEEEEKKEKNTEVL